MNDQPEIEIDLTRLESSVAQWSSDAHVTQAARLRKRREDTQIQLQESTRFDELLVELANTRQPITVFSVSGHRYIGVIVAVTDKVVCLEIEAARVFLRTNAVARLQSMSMELPTLGASNFPEAHLSIATVLAELSFENTPVRLFAAGDTNAISGTIERCAEDFVTLKLNNANESVASVRIGSITEVVVPN